MDDYIIPNKNKSILGNIGDTIIRQLNEIYEPMKFNKKGQYKTIIGTPNYTVTILFEKQKEVKQ